MRPCRICGGELARLLTYANVPQAAQHLPGEAEVAHEAGIELVVCHCTACGVVQLDNEPVHYWRDVIRAVGFSESMRSFRADQFDAFVRRHGLRGAAALEAGCGDGAYLQLLAGAGLDVLGLEHDAANVRRCREQGLSAEQGYIEEIGRLPKAPFAAFFVFSWLEHLPSIPGFLAAVRAQLAEDAVGIVEVPNFDMILKGNLFSEFIVDHLYYFTRDTFQHTLESNGFEVLSCAPVWHDYILSAEVRKRRPLDVSGLEGAYEATLADVRQLYARYSRLALWGAGHQALTLIAMAGGYDSLAYIVDSAPFKQGLYSPVSHRPIVSPEHLRTDPVDALIVAAGSYSDEVCHIARTRYGMRTLFVFRNNRLEPYQEG